MALRRDLTKRLFIFQYRASSPIATVDHSRPSIVRPNASNYNLHREYMTSPDAGERGFFRRFFQRRGINLASSSAKLPEFLNLPVGDKLIEKLKGMSVGGDRIRRGELAPKPTTEMRVGAWSDCERIVGLTVEDARRILRVSLMEKLKAKLREFPSHTVSYVEFVRICVDCCENEAQGLEFAKLLDQSGNVIVLGKVVLLRPEQVVRSVETVLSESIPMPNDPRKERLEEMEKQKAQIDKKAQALVKRELYCGLGLLLAQTLVCMRLTFWELSWDVMEPICFFVTSLHFALAYAFFLRTSKEPSFEGYFQRRFKAKQRKLMKLHDFDVDKFNRLRSAFYPFMNCRRCVPAVGSEYLTSFSGGDEEVFRAL
ncbi:hypothetical protein Nepgr_015717 [Nepenthes gracilis]|uniref:Calcium uniporter protein C-terminal domain-containing protein n=1 Tax=Nepenthes gracilis TaxID=150966 RepID=A0AAD3XRJ6_NEPGR|nr:hypothetical protein Nepgr_015717 [Nepenthes gracilis]